MKIIKWLAILSFTAISIVVLYWVGFAILFSYGAGSGGTGLIKVYEFKGEVNDMKAIFDQTLDKKTIHIRDSIVDGDYRGTFDKRLLIINSDKSNMQYIIELPHNEGSFYFYLIYINGKINDDFGWFSIEKYNNIKLFEKEIIEPLSQKFKRIEAE
ncbi:hypothetical protein [Flavobacterium sp. N1736]|uniref:hypothetical protein n=1 Tax=Flavobacterium sp. N1736 TaxID=2986823 RepID=UPI002225B009|nr:hypothetical protein [Flavobacterium sp. N1736]